MAQTAAMFGMLNNRMKENPLTQKQDFSVPGMIGSPMDRIHPLLQGAAGGLGAAMGLKPEDTQTSEQKARAVQEEMANLNLGTAQGLKDAAKLYQKLGDTTKAMEMLQVARVKDKEEMDVLEQNGKQITEEAKKKRGMAYAHGRLDSEGANAIRGGLISPEDYYQAQLKTDLDTRKTIAGRDPNAGAFTKDVVMGGRTVPVRFAANGEPIAVLGEGRKDVELKTIYNPATGGQQMAVVNKQDPTDLQFVGEGEAPMPEYEVKEVGGKFHTWMTPPGGQPIRVGVTSSMTEAEQQMAQAKSAVKAANLLASVDQAIGALQSGIRIGGIYGPLEYLPATEQRAYTATIDSIKSNVGFDQLAELKAAGGSLGQISNIENMLLQSTIAKLDTWTKKTDQIANLEKVKGITERLQVAATTQNPDDLFQPVMDANGQPSGDRMYVVDSDTIALIAANGQIEIKQRGQN